MPRSKSKTNHPVSSFSPNLLEILRQGCQREMELKFPTEKAATHFGYRINGLRAAMRRENHPDWEQVYRAGVYPHPTDRTKRIVRPRDSEYDSVLKAAGMQLVTDETSPPTASTKIETSGDLAEDFLASLRGTGTKLEDL